MKRIKMLGLATLAALMAMAFVGASSAMAGNTQLCQTETNPCTSAVTHVHETTVSLSFRFSVGIVVCFNLFLSTSVGALGAPQILKGNFTYSSCKRGSESCTVTEQNGPAEIKVLRTAAEEATVTFELEVKVKCGSFINCTYNGEGLEATAKGPLSSEQTNGSVLLDNQVMHKVSGFLCPSTAELDLTTTPLTATYISS